MKGKRFTEEQIAFALRQAVSGIQETFMFQFNQIIGHALHADVSLNIPRPYPGGCK